jgi:hypothetical protein
VTVLTGEVQQLRDGRWRTVLTASGVPVDDRRRRQHEDLTDTLRTAKRANDLGRPYRPSWWA